MARRTARGRVAVLLVSDQRLGRAPDHCVKTGEATSSATKATAVDLAGAPWWQLFIGSGATSLLATVLRRPRQVVVINVSPRAWAVWRWRVIAATVLASFGVFLVVVGLVGGRTGFAVFGALEIVATLLWRAWMSWLWWFGLRLRAGDGHVLVHRTSSAFDADARRLFADAARRR
jgi:hypothetical protein